MKYFFYTSLFLVSMTLFSCEGNEQTEQHEEQMETEHTDSMRKSVLDEADEMLNQGDTTEMPQDSATGIEK
jgi:hypothetical protein